MAKFFFFFTFNLLAVGLAKENKEGAGKKKLLLKHKSPVLVDFFFKTSYPHFSLYNHFVSNEQCAAHIYPTQLPSSLSSYRRKNDTLIKYYIFLNVSAQTFNYILRTDYGAPRRQAFM